VVVAWSEVSAEVDVEDKKVKVIIDPLIAGVFRKNTNQWRELNENIDLW
jgi:hypothetical protein